MSIALPRPHVDLLPKRGMRSGTGVRFPTRASSGVVDFAPPPRHAEISHADLPKEASLRAKNWSNLEFLVVKVTHRCNLRCSYCYEDITSGSDMTVETFKQLASVALESTASDTLGFLFHGGEPTLMEVDWYRQALDYADAKAREVGKVGIYTMQSNLVRMDQDFLELFLERNISLGVSMDGPPELNDSTRGGGLRVVENFIKAKSEGLNVSVLCTINGSNWSKMPELIDWLQNGLHERRFKANVAYPVGAGLGLEPLTSDQVFKAKKDILDHMLETGGNGMVETNLEREVIKFVDGGGECSSSLCSGKLCGAGSRVLGVTSEGGLLPCGRFEWNSSAWNLGHVSQTDDKAFEARGEQMRRFWGVSDHNWANCGTCRARDMCSYSCQAFIARSNRQMNVECIPTLALYDYLASQPFEKVEALAATLKLHQAVKGANYRDSPAFNDSGYNDSGYNDSGYSDR